MEVEQSQMGNRVVVPPGMWKLKLVKSAISMHTYLKASRIGNTTLYRTFTVRARNSLIELLHLFGFFSRSKAVLTEVDGLLLYIHPTRWFMANYLTQRHEPLALELFKSSIRAGSVVLDIGANVGYFSLIAARQAGVSGRVYSFEPGPDNFELLVRNIELNKFANIVPVPKAVSDRRQESALYLAESSDMHSLFAHPISPTKGKIDVECIAIDEFLDGSTVDVVKIDIEGNEPKALDGMVGTIKSNKDLVLFMEYNPACLRRAQFQPSALLEKLEGLGFDVRAIDEETRSLKPLTGDFLREANRKPSSWVVNLYCEKRAAV